MNDRAHGPWLAPPRGAAEGIPAEGCPAAQDLALLQAAAAAWAPWLPGWAEELAAQAAGAPGWLPPGRGQPAAGGAHPAGAGAAEAPEGRNSAECPEGPERPKVPEGPDSPESREGETGGAPQALGAAAAADPAWRVLKQLATLQALPASAWAVLHGVWRLCAAVSLCPTLATGLRQHTGQAALTPALLAPALGWPLHRLLPLLAHNPLRELGLLQPADTGAPLALQGLQVPDAVALRLWGLLPPPASNPAHPAPAAPPDAALAALAAALHSRVPLLALWVDPHGRGPSPESLVPRSRRVAAGPGLAAALGLCLLDDVLPLVIAPDDTAAESEETGNTGIPANTEAGSAAGALTLPAAYPGPVLVLARRANIALAPGARALLVHHVQPLAPAAQARAWARALALPDQPPARAWAQQLARVLPLPPAACAQAATDARLAAALAGRAPGHHELMAAARHRAALAVQGAVDLRPPRATLAQLVLAAPAQAALQHALRLFEHRPEAGLRLLLAGPPGTGKTLAAEAIAHTLQRDLLVVDAGRVLSRWLGETERRLEQAFQAAETAHALLFIDEADALFARRTEVKDAHDRYANAETAYLLQRLERFHGVLVLASNARGSIDSAFTRRFDAVLNFDEPDEAVRALLWAQMLGNWPTTPLPRAEAVALLARWYPMTGAQIRSACRGAPAEAAAPERPAAPGLAPLLQAIAREFHKAGRAFPGLPTLPSAPDTPHPPPGPAPADLSVPPCPARA